MKAIIYFFIFFFLTICLLPEHVVGDIVMNHLAISGDGEEAMDDFYFSVLIIRIIVSSVFAFALASLTGRLLKKKK
ncbi:hypothetical protein [Dickeya zeae]|uniref:hypothetical protein n=1 Tax=Dickeya zeae TaxID=204042 RepID=UPI0003762147|nr:hypothetical protein [Dickeya zeae]PXW45082.1 hypothetical protein DFO54_107118 [Erwinia sp. AG740]UJR52582.1 hypothetical protein J417_09045 [Dickeya zeae MS1]